MKRNILFSAFIALASFSAMAQIKVGNNPTVLNASAELEIESTTKGFLPPRLTTEERDAIVDPAEGLTIYNTTTKCLNWYTGTEWYSPCETETPPVEPEPLVYCSITVQWQVYPVSKVIFAGISNVTASATSTDLTLANQDFTALTGEVTAGESYSITLQGNTGSWAPQVCYFTVFADWNQNGILDDAGEVYQVGTVQGSNGADSVQAIGAIAVPATALSGNTRMRVLYNTDSYGMDPCATYSWAQAEDYTLHVSN